MSNPLQNFLFITGFMGSGKTTLSEGLSNHYKCPLYELDSEIERSLGSEILEIFSTRGEAFFRKVETEILHKIVRDKSSGIVSTGGGVVISSINRKLMRNNGKIMWLAVPPGEIITRLEKQGLQRPLATKNGTVDLDSILELYRKRIPTYLQCHTQVYGVGTQEAVLIRSIQSVENLFKV